MAKNIITQQEYSEYERLVKKYQRFRRKIIKEHKALQESARSPSRLPQLVAPERIRKVRYGQIQFMGRKAFNAKKRAIESVLSAGEEGIHREYKKTYLELYRMLISVTPMGMKNKYQKTGQIFSEQQILDADFFYGDENLSDLMKLYNQMFRLNSTVFYYAIKKGDIKPFNKIYDEFMERVVVQDSFIKLSIEGVKRISKAKPDELKKMIENAKQKS